MKKSLHRYGDDISFFIKENSCIARIAAMHLHASQMAIVWGRTVHLHNTSAGAFLKNERWVRHEMTHIKQFRQYGLSRFIFLYLSESIRRGYHQNKFEVEARQAETGSPLNHDLNNEKL